MVWASNEALGIRTAEDAERHRRSRADASLCCGCGAPVADGDAVWLIPCRVIIPHPAGIGIYHDAYAAGCPSCAAAWAKKPLYHSDPRRPRVEPGQCPCCGRVVHLLDGGLHVRSFLCSDRCRNRVHGARYRKRHPRPKTVRALVQCQECGENFEPKRCGAKTCSPACRQKAYRRRRAVTDTSKDDIVSSCPPSVTQLWP